LARLASPENSRRGEHTGNIRAAQDLGALDERWRTDPLAAQAEVLADLRAEELRRATVFDVRLLAARLTGITRWLRRHPACMGTIRSASSAPVSAASDGKYGRRRSSRNSSWPLMPS
jgi:hypothetical protein